MSIFIADPAERDQAMESLVGTPGQMHFRAIHLGCRLPWYIVSRLVTIEDVEICQDVLLEHVQGLGQHLAEDAPGRVIGLAVVEPSNLDGSHQWQLRQVKTVWECERDDHSTFIALVDDSGETCDPMHSGVHASASRRVRIIAEFT